MTRAVVLLLCAPVLRAQEPQHPPLFRTGTVLVPLDVRSTKAQKGGQHAVEINLTVDAAAIRFTPDAGRDLASFEAALFVANRSGRQIGQMRKRIDLKLTPANREALQKDGIVFSAMVNATERPRYVKAVVYD